MKGSKLDARGGLAALAVRALDDRGRLFWALQTGGWLSYFVLYFTYGLDIWREGWSFADAVPNAARLAALATITGVVITCLLRLPYQRLRRLPIGEALTFALPFLVVGALVFSFLEGLAIAGLYGDWSWSRSLLLVPTKLYLLGAWSALYFSITYYMQLKRETERALRADAEAQQAQLQMLRYQLNPHFLFNALNAVSALVLEEDTKRADRLVSRLSAFLRHSLVSEAKEKVTIEQEISANLLYLEIEKTRFADRLDFTTEIEPEARHALAPSLILQPLIENAVKYAVAPREEGGHITVRAMARARRLILVVEDDGPGIPQSATEILSPQSCGVGLANIARRLRHVYGDTHRFQISNRAEGGARIEIEVPFELGQPHPAVTDAMKKAA